MNRAHAVYNALTDARLNTCFATPGASELQLVYAMGRTGNVRAVRCLEENGVTGAADRYAHLAGTPACTLRQDRTTSRGGL
jgi:acetolactate synthase I/II/III large subunit